MASRRVAAAAVVVATVAAWLAYQTAPPRVADVVIVPYAAGLVLGPAVVFALLRGAGASGGRALAASLVIPALWLAKELVRVTAVFSWGEAAYYALNPIALGVYTAAVAPAAALELWLQRRRGGRPRFASPAGLTLAVVALLALGAALVGHDSGGRDLFYGYIAVYRWLFPGQG